MGSSYSIIIEFDRNPAIYYGIELVTGILRLIPADLRLQNKQLSIKLIGKATYEVVYYPDGEKRREILTFTFLSKTVIFNQPSSSEENSPMSFGRVSWPFEIELSKYAPSAFVIPRTFHKNHPAVEYSIVACLQQAAFGITDTKRIFFHPPILIEPQTSAILSAVSINHL
jgi:hypothetical protein